MAEDESSNNLVAVLHDRYGCTEPMTFNIQITGKAPGKTDSGVLVLPSALCLDHQNISCLGDVQELADLCKRITELDISHNNIKEWKQVLQLLEVLPHLQLINISDNPLCSSDSLNLKQSIQEQDSQNSDKLAASQVSKLVLNSLRISWEDVWTLLGLLPKVQELHLSINSFTTVDPPQDGATFPGVKELFLNHNKLSRWESIAMLGQTLPGLNNIIMIDNPIETLCGDLDLVTQTFPAVTCANLSKSSLSSWEQVESLNSWPQLRDVRLQGIPLYEDYTPEVSRQLTIAYLPEVTRLNGTPVTPAEREDAERMFIRHYMDGETRPARYDTLHAAYGDLDPLVNVDLKPTDRVTVTLFWGEGKSCLREVETTWTLKKLKSEFAEVVGLEPNKMYVFHNEVQMPIGLSLMKFPNRMLHSYQVREGDEIHIYDSPAAKN